MDAVSARNFAQAIASLKQEALSSLSIDDANHLKKVIWTNRFFFCLGFITAWIYPNPLSMIAISLSLTGTWCVVVHHVCHGGYDKVPGLAKHYHSERFAMGWRRYLDWFDWIYPPAWKYEHNVLHHFYTNEKKDPDQMSYAPQLKKRSLLVNVAFFIIHASSWKATYYAYNVYWFYGKKNNLTPTQFHSRVMFFNILPYILFHFVLLPLLFLPLGWHAVFFVLINRIGGEIISNWHTFLVIAPNHTGSDLALHQTHYKTKEAFYINQIKSTCNYHTGGFWQDYFQGYLNYQIEHHLYPDLPPSQYVKLQPKVKALCEQYGIDYIQEPVFTRIRKLIKIMHVKEVMQSA